MCTNSWAIVRRRDLCVLIDLSVGSWEEEEEEEEEEEGVGG